MQSRREALRNIALFLLAVTGGDRIVQALAEPVPFNTADAVWRPIGHVGHLWRFDAASDPDQVTLLVYDRPTGKLIATGKAPNPETHPEILEGHNAARVEHGKWHDIRIEEDSLHVTLLP